MIRRLLYLNGLAVLGVITYHASAWGFISLFWWTDTYLPVSTPNFDQIGSVTYYALRIIEQLIIFGIPSFLFVSGFFIAIATGRSRSTIGWDTVLARIRSLVIPFLIWSVLIMVSKIAQGQTFTVVEFIIIVLTGGAEPPYYYVPVLVQLYLLAPFLVPLARDRWKPLLLISAVIQLVAVSLRYSLILNLDYPVWSPLAALTPSWLFPPFIFFFVFGIVIGFHLTEFKKWLSRYRWLFLAGVCIFFILGILEWELLLRSSGQSWIGPRETLIDHLYAGAFILSFLAFDRIALPLRDQVSNLGGKSYGIYLLHSPVQEFTARTIYHVAPWMFAYQFLFQPVLWIVGMGAPLIFMAFINRSRLRRYYSVLFG